MEGESKEQEKGEKRERVIVNILCPRTGRTGQRLSVGQDSVGPVGAVLITYGDNQSWMRSTFISCPTGMLWTSIIYHICTYQLINIAHIIMDVYL